jgi:hypothetical protein
MNLLFTLAISSPTCDILVLDVLATLKGILYVATPHRWHLGQFFYVARGVTTRYVLTASSRIISQ